MSNKSTVEIDFFRMERQNASSRPPSFPEWAGGAPSRGIQSLVSRINPQLLKTVMSSGGAAGGRPLPSSSLSSLPVLNPAASRATASQCVTETAPLTIFYNGTVAAFDVPPDQAELIIRMAGAGIVDNHQTQKESSPSSLGVGGQLDGDLLPLARSKSLRRFLEKRKERLALASPYHEGISHPC